MTVHPPTVAAALSTPVRLTTVTRTAVGGASNVAVSGLAPSAGRMRTVHIPFA